MNDNLLDLFSELELIMWGKTGNTIPADQSQRLFGVLRKAVEKGVRQSQEAREGEGVESEIARFVRDFYPDTNHERRLEHFLCEVQELQNAAPGRDRVDEAADCALILFHMMQAEGAMPLKAMARKLAEARRRIEAGEKQPRPFKAAREGEGLTELPYDKAAKRMSEMVLVGAGALTFGHIIRDEFQPIFDSLTAEVSRLKEIAKHNRDGFEEYERKYYLEVNETERLTTQLAERERECWEVSEVLELTLRTESMSESVRGAITGSVNVLKALGIPTAEGETK